MKPAAAGDEHRRSSRSPRRRRGSSRTASRAGLAQRAPTARRAPRPTRVDRRDERPGDAADVGAASREVEVEGEQHSEAGGRAGRGVTLTDAHSRVFPEQPLEARVRPAPVVVGRRVVDHHAVCRGEHAPAGRGHPVELADRLRRVVARARAPGCRGRRRSSRRRPAAPRPSRVAPRSGSRPDRPRRTEAARGEERLVRLLAAADVEHAGSGRVVVARASSAREPARERRAHRVGGHRAGRIEASVRRPLRLECFRGRQRGCRARARLRRPVGMPATRPSAVQMPTVRSAARAARAGPALRARAAHSAHGERVRPREWRGQAQADHPEVRRGLDVGVLDAPRGVRRGERPRTPVGTAASHRRRMACTRWHPTTPCHPTPTRAWSRKILPPM